MGSRASFSLGNHFYLHLLLFILSLGLTPIQPVLGSTEVIYDPVVYARGTDQHATIIDTFSVSKIVGTFTLVIENGDPSTAADRGTSALINLNGATVDRPNEFKK